MRGRHVYQTPILRTWLGRGTGRVGSGRWRTFRTRQLSHYEQVSPLQSPRARKTTDSRSNVDAGTWRRRLQPIVTVHSSFHWAGQAADEENGTEVGGWVKRPAASGQTRSASVDGKRMSGVENDGFRSRLEPSDECAREGSGPGDPGRDARAASPHAFGPPPGQH